MTRQEIERIVFSIVGVFAIFYAWSLAYCLALLVMTHSARVLAAFTTGWDVSLPIEQVYANWNDPRMTKLVLLASAATTVLGVAAAAAWMTRVGANRPKGGARFAGAADLKNAKLLGGIPGYSILLGKAGGKELRYSGDSHLYVNGPTRSGKGVSFALLNAQEWRGSLIALDIKHELFEETGPARLAMGQKCFMFAPGSEQSDRWNPMDWIRPWPGRATDLGNIALALIEAPKHGDAYWAETARGLFAGVLGYVAESKTCEGQRTIRSALRMMSQGVDLAEVFARTLQDEPELSPYVQDYFRQHMGREKKQRPSFESHITSSLRAWNNTLIAEATSWSDFDITALRKTPMSIFIGTAAGDLRSAEPVIRLFIQQVHDVLMRKLPGGDEPSKVLFMLDEFYQFGRFPEIVDVAPLVAAYGFKIAIIAQNIPQLDVKYGKDVREMLMGNTDVKVFVGIGDKATADYVSAELGREYVAREGWGSSESGMRRNRSTQGRWEQVPLMAPEDVKALPESKSIVLVRGHAPVVVDKIKSFKDKRWLAVRKATAAYAPKLRVPVLQGQKELPWGQVFAPEAKAPEAVAPAEGAQSGAASPSNPLAAIGAGAPAHGVGSTPAAAQSGPAADVRGDQEVGAQNLPPSIARVIPSSITAIDGDGTPTAASEPANVSAHSASSNAPIVSGRAAGQQDDPGANADIDLPVLPAYLKPARAFRQEVDRQTATAAANGKGALAVAIGRQRLAFVGAIGQLSDASDSLAPHIDRYLVSK